MELSNLDIGLTIKEALESHKPSTQFEKTWTKKSNLRKIHTLPLVAIITCLAFFIVGFASYRLIIDEIAYPFVNDASVIGKWKSIDFVKDIKDFDPAKRLCKEELFVKELVFINDGKMLGSFEDGNLTYTPITWTKGKVISEQVKTASGYEVRSIKGKSYLFLQWKSGDYIIRGMEPYFYVFEKVDSMDYSNFKIIAIEDKVDYPFEADDQMIGGWESVDYVKDISLYTPNSKSRHDDLFIIQIDILNDGEIAITSTTGKNSDSISWTKGLILDKQSKTASKCIIKEIDGAVYMFYEWKSGDYTYGGMKPFYYVLKKIT